MRERLKILKALSDETRLRIVEFLLRGERCVCEIVPYSKRAQPTVSIQLSKLEDLGVLKSRREGRSVYYRIANPRVIELLGLLNKSRNTAGGAISYRPIGIVHTPFRRARGTPIQSVAAEGVEGTIELLPEYAEGLRDIEGFSHIILIYHFHRSREAPLVIKPYMDTTAHGVFATRSPSRPNPVGMSISRIIGVDENQIHIKDIDIIDGTPLIDIKPYVPDFDIRDSGEIGWLTERVHALSASKDDGRFSEDKQNGQR